MGIPACVKAPTETSGGDTAVETNAGSETKPASTATETEEAAESETEPAPAVNGGIKFKDVAEVVYPYTDNVRAYLDAGDDADVAKFMNGSNDQHEDITIEWEYTGEDKISSVIFEYARNVDFSDSVSVTLTGATVKRRLSNLYKATKYYIRVTAVGENGSVSDTASFETTSLGPRIMNVGGYYGNVRDMGGYVTEDGLTVLQDKAFRGSALDNCVDANSSTLNGQGKKYLNNEVKIKTEMDFRATTENCGRTTPALDSAENYLQIPIVNFQGAFYKDQASLYCKVFRAFADESNYPIYFHCAAGADRTGTVAAILLALLGVGRTEIIQDFEITSFSKVGERSRGRLIPVFENLERYNGDTLSKKTENYLISIGLTKREIYNIKAIMLGLDPDGYTEEKTYELQTREFRYSTAKGGDIKLTLLEESEVGSISAGGAELLFTQDGKNITVPEETLKNMGKGSFICTVAFKDGGSLQFSVIIDEADISDGIKVTHISQGPGSDYYSYVFISYPYGIFDGIEYHLHSRPEEFPYAEENVLINGASIKELNGQSISKYTFAEFPGNSMDRYKVPVTMLCQGNTVTLLIHTGWLDKYKGGGELNITIKDGFEFTYNGIRYYMSKDKTFVSSGSVFREE